MNPKDYSLTGPESQRAVALGLAEADWYAPPVPKDKMRDLLTSKDWSAIRDCQIYFGLILATGYWAWSWWPSCWAVVPLMIYGVLYASASDSRWHESGHGFQDKSLGAMQLWELYMTLLKAETGFCQLKGTLGLRPNFHQLEDCLDGHIFISVLAYHLLCWINKRLEEHSDTCDWQTIRRLLGTHSLVTTRLPLADGRTINIRKPSQPDDEQKHVCQMLDIDWKSAFPTRKTEIPA